MYVSLKNVLLLLALFKKRGIRHVVLSPGGCNVSLVRSIENDPFFTCYSVVDERSAAYFAMGISQTLCEPVVALCTSGTAVCNYLPGVTEAFYQGVQLILVTADRDPYLYKQMETQKVNQFDIFKDVTKKEVVLPIVKDDNDYWYCERLINEALLELDHHGTGPIHINVPTAALAMQVDYSIQHLPDAKLIERLDMASSKSIWEQKGIELKKYGRILVVFGQDQRYSQEDEANILRFAEKYNCVLSVENISNLTCDQALYTYPVTEMMGNKGFEQVHPDLVISVGYNLSGIGVKNYLRAKRGTFKHWLVDLKGEVKDVFKSLNVIFECSTSEFFRYFGNCVNEGASNNNQYRSDWQALLSRITLPDLPFSNIYVAKKLAETVPEHSLLHLGILNSTRNMQFFRLKPDVTVFSNIGALGIDGSMSTFIGQAIVAAEKLCFLLIGDLSFFYDMNSVWIRHLSSNVRIIMINNFGAGEFHFQHDKVHYPRINEHISVEHRAVAKGWVESLGFKYISASNKVELDTAFAQITVKADRPVFVEVFVDMEADGQMVREMYASNKVEESTPNLHQGLRKILGNKTVDTIKTVLKY